MPSAGGAFTPMPVLSAPWRNLARTVLHDRKLVTLLTVVIVAALAAAAIVGYMLGTPDHSVRVEQSGVGRIVLMNDSRTAGCIKSGSTRLCSEFAVTGRYVPKLGDKVGYAHEWANIPIGSEDLLLIYSLDD